MDNKKFELTDKAKSVSSAAKAVSSGCEDATSDIEAVSFSIEDILPFSGASSSGSDTASSDIEDASSNDDGSLSDTGDASSGDDKASSDTGEASSGDGKASSDTGDAPSTDDNAKSNTKDASPKHRFKIIDDASRVTEKVLSPFNKVIDDVQRNYSNSSRIKKTIIAMFNMRVWICIPLIAIIVLGSCYFAFQSEKTASVEMSLNYEEAANGLNPNSTRFNAYNISSKDVVERMLWYCGIDPESVNVDKICDGISINATNNKSFSEGEYYISTTYKITLNRHSSIKDIKTEDLITYLCKSYKDNFYSRYTENRSILEFDIEVFNDKEYLEIADLLDIKAQQIKKYLNTRSKQSKSYVEAESDETFKSLVQKVEDIQSYDIAKYRTFVTMAGCSDDKARFISALEYVNRLMGISYKKDMAGYTVRNDGIKMYDDDMISVVMIPSIDDSKNTYYMSKTKTGMDYIAKEADDMLDSAQQTSKEITVNEDIISKMAAGTNSKENLDKASQMIADIRNKFTELSRQIEAVDKAYVKYRTKDYLTFKPVKKSLIQRLRLVFLFEVAAGLLVLIFVVIWLKFRMYKKGGKAE